MSVASWRGTGTAVAAAAWLGGAVLAWTAAPQEPTGDIRAQILSAEDRRAPAERELRLLVSAVADRDPQVARLATRALGRLERPALTGTIGTSLQSPDPGVRIEAANALAQAVSAARDQPASSARAGSTGDPVEQVRQLLVGQLQREGDAAVRGVICESLGRLPYSQPGDLQAVERILVTATFAGSPDAGGAGRDANLVTLVGAVKGLESLLRQNAKTLAPSSATIDRLRALATSRTAAGEAPQVAERARTPSGSGSTFADAPLRADPTGTLEDDIARVRRLALLALQVHVAADDRTLSSAMGDDQWEVRRIAVRSAGAALRTPGAAARGGATAIVMRGLGDADWRVRWEALSALGRGQDAPSCRVLLTALADPNLHVSLLAADLAWRCGPDSDAPRILGGLVRQLPAGEGAWHRPAHALVSLARLAPEQASAQLGRFLTHPTWQVREYVARAATIAKAASVLRTLAADGQDNVRTAAVTGLSAVERHAADDVFIAQLARDDGELVRAAATALEGTPDHAGAIPPLLTALARMTKARRETSRDARLALLDRIGELGSGEQARSLEPYLEDFDPHIARAASAILKRWTGVERAVKPGRSAAAPPPTLGEVQVLQRATAVVRMKRGGSFTLALLTADAPAGVVRFARLARAGYYDGLTFHRVEPGSLIQGGSPGANEYSGDGPFMRDEVGLASNRRGTVGVSTRGRDTGDAQWYVNLVDNARYDHNYTVFAIVVTGMDVVDAVVEGDAIEDVRIVTK